MVNLSYYFYCRYVKNTFTLDDVQEKTSSFQNEISELKNVHQNKISAHQEEISELKNVHQEEISELKNQVAELRSLVTKAKAERKNVPQSPQAEDTELERVETMDEHAGGSGENDVLTGHSPIEVSESKTKLAEYRSLVIRTKAEDKPPKYISQLKTKQAKILSLSTEIISQLKTQQAAILSLTTRAKAKDIISEIKSEIARIRSLVTWVKAAHKNVPQSPEAEDTEVETVETMNIDGEHVFSRTGHSQVEVAEEKTAEGLVSKKETKRKGNIVTSQINKENIVACSTSSYITDKENSIAGQTTCDTSDEENSIDGSTKYDTSDEENSGSGPTTCDKSDEENSIAGYTKYDTSDEEDIDAGSTTCDKSDEEKSIAGSTTCDKNDKERISDWLFYGKSGKERISD